MAAEAAEAAPVPPAPLFASATAVLLPQPCMTAVSRTQLLLPLQLTAAWLCRHISHTYPRTFLVIGQQETSRC